MIINVKVKPGRNLEEVKKVDGQYIVSVKARAIKGKANEAVVKLLAKEFNVKREQVIIKTSRGRLKLIEVKK